MLKRIGRVIGGICLVLVLGQANWVQSQAELTPNPLPPVRVAADTLAIFPTEDTYIASGRTNDNFGQQDSLRLGYDGTEGSMRSLIRFDVANQLPDGAVVDSALLQVYVYDSEPSVDPPLVTEIYRIDSAWGETFVKWNNQPSIDNTVMATGALNRDVNFYTFDVTSLVQDWMTGTQEDWGMMLLADASGPNVRYRNLYSRERGGGLFPPRLTIEYSEDGDAPMMQIESMPRYSPEAFTVRWCGIDGATGTGILNYDVQYRINGGEWVDWLVDTTSTSAGFNGTSGNRFDFRVRATDNAGNVGAYTADDAATTQAGIPHATMTTISPPIRTNTDSLRIGWLPTLNNESIGGYQVYYWLANDEPSNYTNTTVGTSAFFTPRDGDGIYQFEVVALSASSVGETQLKTAEGWFILDTKATPTATINYLPYFSRGSSHICSFS